MLLRRLQFSPQTDPLTCCETTSIRPSCAALPFVSSFIAESAMLNPDCATSMARTLVVFVVPWASVYESCQHVPQLGEFHPVTACAPPMCGKRGRLSKVLNPRVMRPLGPSEQATEVSEVPPLSYLVSKETVVATVVDVIMTRAREASIAKNIMVDR